MSWNRTLFHGPGVLLALGLSACTASTKTPDAGVPDFNYIPANKGKCSADSSPTALPSIRRALGTVAALPTERAVELSVCPKAATPGDPCAPCESNPFVDYIAAVDNKSLEGTNAPKSDGSAMLNYMRRALSYPLRELLVHSVVSPDASGKTLALALTQGRTTCTELGFSCPWYELQPESLEADCATLTQYMTVASDELAGGSRVITGKEGSRPFSFFVPLVDELPEPSDMLALRAEGAAKPAAGSDDLCPPAEAVVTEEDFARFISCQPTWQVDLESPVLRIRRTPQASCVYITGFIDSEKLPAGATSLVAPDDFESAEAPGSIQVTLRAELRQALGQVVALPGTEH